MECAVGWPQKEANEIELKETEEAINSFLIKMNQCAATKTLQRLRKMRLPMMRSECQVGPEKANESGLKDAINS